MKLLLETEEGGIGIILNIHPYMCWNVGKAIPYYVTIEISSLTKEI